MGGERYSHIKPTWGWAPNRVWFFKSTFFKSIWAFDLTLSWKGPVIGYTVLFNRLGNNFPNNLTVYTALSHLNMG